MRLSSLSMENFRGFERREFQLHPQFNLLIGENGSGKTSLLEAASIAIGAWLLAFPSTDARHIRLRDVRRVSEDLGGRYRELPQYPVRITAIGEISQTEGNEAASHTASPIPVTWERTLN